MNPRHETSKAEPATIPAESAPFVPHETYRPQTSTRPRTGSSGGVAGLVLTALLMAAGSVSLATYQWLGMRAEPAPVANQPDPEPSPVVPVASAPPLAAEPEPLPPPEPEAAAPAFSDEELAAMQAQADRLEREAEALRNRSEAESVIVEQAVASLKKMRGTAASSVIAAQTASLEREAAKATLDSLNRRYAELSAETAQVLKTPKPPREALSGFSPVAKPARGQEYHFEVRGDRVSFIDIQQLLELVKKDVQIRMRLSGSPRGIQSEVGPVGEFGLAYEIGPMNDTLGGTGVGLKGWEVVPLREDRGETVERSAQPLSEFDRAIRKLSPTSATITMWVYPDGFGTFRLLRDRLHAQGFMVAARPLPDGIPVRGSPMGSISAGQ